jgi:hypothetical protein
MENDFGEILRSVPIKRSRSPLEPYRSLVEELHRRGLPLRQIARVLAQRCYVQTSHVAIHRLLQHKYPRAVDPWRQGTAIQVAADKSVKDGATGATAGEFHFEPNEPLKLSPRNAQKS